MPLQLYGIPNCDTVKKVRRALDSRGVVHDFRDFKKEGVDPAQLARWAARVGWEKLLNRSGTTFRRLDEADRRDLDEARALALMAAHPSMIRRPVIEGPDDLLIVGNDADAIANLA